MGCCWTCVNVGMGGGWGSEFDFLAMMVRMMMRVVAKKSKMDAKNQQIFSHHTTTHLPIIISSEPPLTHNLTPITFIPIHQPLLSTSFEPPETSLHTFITSNDNYPTNCPKTIPKHKYPHPTPPQPRYTNTILINPPSVLQPNPHLTPN